jgi:hypothetical protein
MPIILATKTLAAINHQMESDQGASYRVALGKVIPFMKDAYRGENEGFRSHLGASVIGKPCARQIWYGFRWAVKPKFNGQMLRLFNRGHLEEARFIAALLCIGVQVYQQDSNGNQFRISDVGGHFGGSGDGVGIGIPDVPINTPCLLEFKTHNDKSYKKLVESGVKVVKPEHHTQMVVYMRKMNLPIGLYGAVNKNDDQLHLELIHLDPIHSDQFLDRARTIIMLREPPKKINESPGWFECKFCDMKAVCHGGVAPERNCRTCYHIQVHENGTWVCGQTGEVRTKEQQLAGCGNYLVF